MSEDTDKMALLYAALRKIDGTAAFWSAPLRYPKYLLNPAGCLVSVVGRTPRALKPGYRGKYRGFTLVNADGVLESVYLHRLVLDTFDGPAPDRFQGAHLDGNRENNSLSNLRWVTVRENHQHKVRHGTSGKGSTNSCAVLTEAQVADMRRIRRDEGVSYKQLAERFGVSTMTAFRAATGRLWSHVGDTNV
ncbi:MAG: HNH endonuclease [Burkholderiaceae bacterium]|nr:HNH endonuclease [Burkholderiaceae bacterium]